MPTEVKSIIAQVGRDLTGRADWTPEIHSSCCALWRLPNDMSNAVVEFGKTIPADELASNEKGREDEPHVTVLYGIDDITHLDEVRKIAATYRPVIIEFGKISLFKNGDVDVLKVDITSDELNALHKELRKKIPNCYKFDTYHPHVTIAYLKKGEGKKYAGVLPMEMPLYFQTALMTEFLFVDKYDTKTIVSLGSANSHGTIVEGRRSLAPSKRYSFIGYHGTSFVDFDTFFTDPDTSYSDHQAIWFASQESAAQKFADRYGDDRVQAVLKAQVKLKKAAIIDNAVADRILDEIGESDLRDAIPALIQAGYDGWITTGGIGRERYEDVAVFDGAGEFTSEMMKIRLPGKPWTEYMDLQDAEDFVEKHFENNTVTTESVTVLQTIGDVEYKVNNPENPGYFSAFVDGKKIAYMTTDPIERDGKTYCSIKMVHVDKKYREQRIATNLYRLALQAIKDAGFAGLHSYNYQIVTKKPVKAIHRRLQSRSIKDGDEFLIEDFDEKFTIER